MIHLHFSIKNPWHNEARWPWRDYYQGARSVTKNKTIEWSFDFYPIVLAHLHLDTSWHGKDHAGPQLNFGLLGFGLSVGLHDNRHWDYKNNNWAQNG